MTTDTTPAHSMTTDTPSEAGLVERLHNLATHISNSATQPSHAPIASKAAAHITALEAESAALRDMLRRCRPYVDAALTKDQGNG